MLGGLRDSGLVETRDYRLSIRNAQGDMATMNSLVDAAISDRTDLLITFSTPTLQAAIQRSQGVPVVFNYVANAVWAGAGRSDTDHLPNVTGVYLPGAYDEMVALIREVLPQARVLGTLYVPSEVNTVYHRDQFGEAARKAGLEFVTVAANTASEVADAALSLASRKIDAICQLPGNLTASAFPTIAEAARRSGLPLFGFQTSAAEAGAHLVVARDYRDGGAAAARLAVRIMRGESPASIPFEPASETKLVANVEAAPCHRSAHSRDGTGTRPTRDRRPTDDPPRESSKIETQNRRWGIDPTKCGGDCQGPPRAKPREPLLALRATGAEAQRGPSGVPPKPRPSP